MTRLVAALHTLGLNGEVAPGDRWAKLQGERCCVFVVEVSWDGGFYSWCDDPQARSVEFFLDPVEAIQAGMSRAAKVS